MHKVIKWKANDGSEWNSQTEAVTRESMIAMVNKAMGVLKTKPVDCNFEGYIQQDKESMMKCKRLLYDIANTEGILKYWLDKQKKDHYKTDQILIENCHPSWFGRMLGGGHQPLSNAYGRLCCIDDEFKEWNQPYFAMNPGTGKKICLG